jgi:flagellar biosynthesis/type III secretory pathway M-ring protein FliF/YscJ
LQELNTETIEQETGKNVAMEQDLTTQVSVGVGVGFVIIVIGVVLVVVIVRRRRRTGKFFPNIKEMTCQRRKQVIPTQC